jgi:hypothetical protein
MLASWRRCGGSALVVAAAIAAGWLGLAAAQESDPGQGGKRGVEAAELKPAVGRIQPQLGGLVAGQAEVQDQVPPAVVYLSTPVTASAAKSWEKLDKVVAFNFPNETPLEDVLKYIKVATEEPKEKGLQIYVDPLALQEAERMMTSPISMDLDHVSIAKGLKLALRQLSLQFRVDQDGLVIVEAESDENHLTDPAAKALEELAAIRAELQSLRQEIGLARTSAGDRPLAPQVTALRHEIATLQELLQNERRRSGRPPSAEEPRAAGARQ